MHNIALEPTARPLRGLALAELRRKHLDSDLGGGESGCMDKIIDKIPSDRNRGQTTVLEGNDRSWPNTDVDGLRNGERKLAVCGRSGWNDHLFMKTLALYNLEGWVGRTSPLGSAVPDGRIAQTVPGPSRTRGDREQSAPQSAARSRPIVRTLGSAEQFLAAALVP